ncbi:winged helix-turn-helix domain-containing protein [Enterobacter sp. BNK-8]|uniref:winged helix-turn-helix domain-containing protein n=1 Tax=Enterobacter sp. BNK-8 TaxID=3376145 RepID=UPI003B513B0E
MNTEQNERGSAQANMYAAGFLIANEVVYLVSEQILISIDCRERPIIKLRTTMANLLKYLLENSQNEIISDEELMDNIWEKHNLRASNARLWQVMREMRNRLSEAGLTKEIFYRVGRKGYVVRANEIEVFFSEKRHNETKMYNYG